MSKDFNREMIEELSEIGTKFYVIPGPFYLKHPELEWIKWLSYESKREKQIKRKLNNKNVSELSLEDKEMLIKYQQYDRMKDLIIKYVNMECTKDEILQTYDFLATHSISNLMLDKLTNEELKTAKDKLKEFANKNTKELYKIIDDVFDNDRYKELSMIDAYVIHQLDAKTYEISKVKMDQKRLIYDRENTEISIKSGIYSQNKKCMI